MTFLSQFFRTIAKLSISYIVIVSRSYIFFLCIVLISYIANTAGFLNEMMSVTVSFKCTRRTSNIGFESLMSLHWFLRIYCYILYCKSEQRCQ